MSVQSKGEQTREAILRHATSEASRVGLEGLTIGSLARQLQMSKSGLYAHFESKEALQLQILEHLADAFTQQVIRVALKAPRGEARVRALFEGWLAWICRESVQGCLFVAASAELDDRPGATRERLVSQQRDLLELFAGVVVTAIKQGDFSGELDPEQFTAEAHGILLGFHHHWRLLEDPKARTRAESAFERLLASARA